MLLHIFQLEVGNMDKFAKKLWENDFGNNEVGYDFDGCEVRKGSYDQKGSQYGWNIDHIFPESMGGSNDFSNLQVTHMETNTERGNKNTFWIDGTKYQIKRITHLSENDEVADYPYNGKEYCIVILEHSAEYYEEEERQWHFAIGDDDYPY